MTETTAIPVTTPATTSTATGGSGEQGNAASQTSGTSQTGGSTSDTKTAQQTGSTGQSSVASTASQEPDASAMRAYLDEKTSDAKTPEGKAKLDGKTPSELAEMYKALKTTETTTTDIKSFSIPDEYKDKPWAAKVTSEAELWKALNGAQELIGKKSIVPDLKTATPEQREEFYKQMRPADVSAYVFTGDMASPDVRTAVGAMFLENGISEVQGNAIIEKYQALGETEQAKMFEPEGLTTTLKAQFGDDWEKVTGTAYNNLKAMMSDQDQALMEKLPNAYAGLIYRTLGNTDKAVQAMMQRYGVKETSIAHFAGSTHVAGGDINVTRADIRAQMGRLTSGPHTADQIQELRTKLAKTYENDPRIQK